MKFRSKAKILSLVLATSSFLVPNITLNHAIVHASRWEDQTNQLIQDTIAGKVPSLSEVKEMLSEIPPQRVLIPTFNGFPPTSEKDYKTMLAKANLLLGAIMTTKINDDYGINSEQAKAIFFRLLQHKNGFTYPISKNPTGGEGGFTFMHYLASPFEHPQYISENIQRALSQNNPFTAFDNTFGTDPEHPNQLSPIMLSICFGNPDFYTIANKMYPGCSVREDDFKNYMNFIRLHSKPLSE